MQQVSNAACFRSARGQAILAGQQLQATRPVPGELTRRKNGACFAGPFKRDHGYKIIKFDRLIALKPERIKSKKPNPSISHLGLATYSPRPEIPIGSYSICNSAWSKNDAISSREYRAKSWLSVKCSTPPDFPIK